MCRQYLCQDVGSLLGPKMKLAVLLQLGAATRGHGSLAVQTTSGRRATRDLVSSAATYTTIEHVAMMLPC